MLHSLGPLRYPFIAGAAAIVAMCIITGASIARYADEGATIGGLVGLLGVVVLYAICRAAREHDRATSGH